MNVYRYFVSHYICTVSFFLKACSIFHFHSFITLNFSHPLAFMWGITGKHLIWTTFYPLILFGGIWKKNIVILSFLRGKPTLRVKLVTISLNFTDSCLLIALSIDWSTTYELDMNLQQAAVLRSSAVCHTILPSIRCDFCNFISGRVQDWLRTNVLKSAHFSCCCFLDTCMLSLWKV